MSTHKYDHPGYAPDREREDKLHAPEGTQIFNKARIEIEPSQEDPEGKNRHISPGKKKHFLVSPDDICIEDNAVDGSLCDSKIEKVN